MRATARVVAVADGAGGTRLAVLRGEPPLLPRWTGARGAAGDTAEVHLVGGAAGPLRGDVLRLEIEVGAGARLRVRTVAATVALPGARDAPSRMEVHATVAAGGRLDWLPEPLIAARGCDHLSVSTVELHSAASLLWREELVCGRHGEDSGDACLSATVRVDAEVLYRNDLTIGTRAPGWTGSAMLGSARATGSVLVVDPGWAGKPPPARVLGPTAALMPLAGSAVVAYATGTDLRDVRAALDPLVLERAVPADADPVTA